MAEFTTTEIQGNMITNNTYKGMEIGTNCIVCHEYIELSEKETQALIIGMHIHSKICDKCREAIMRIRKEMENEELVKERD